VYIYTFDFIQVCMLLYIVIVEEGEGGKTRDKTVHMDYKIYEVNCYNFSEL
jgi:hypothetical protein